MSTSVLTMHTGALADRMLALRTTVSRRRSELKALQHDVVKTTSAFVDASDVDAMRMHSVCRSSTDVEQTKRVLNDPIDQRLSAMNMAATSEPCDERS